MNRIDKSEQVIPTPINGLILTSYRVRTNLKAGNDRFQGSIMLDELSFCGIHRTSNPRLILQAFVLLIISIVAGGYLSGWGRNEEVMLTFAGTGLLLFIILIFSYFGSIKKHFMLGSGGGKIEFQVSGVSREQMRTTIDIIEKTRLELLSNDCKPFQSTEPLDSTENPT